MSAETGENRPLPPARGPAPPGASAHPDFACGACGGVSISLPAPLTDVARVRCRGCGTDHGSWARFKAGADAIIAAGPPPAMG